MCVCVCVCVYVCVCLCLCVSVLVLVYFTLINCGLTLFKLGGGGYRFFSAVPKQFLVG